MSTPLRLAPSPTAERRILAVLECRPSDDAVCRRALELAERSGGFLTIALVQPRPFLEGMNGTGWAYPKMTEEELREASAEVLRARLAATPGDCSVRGLVVEGRTTRAVRKLVAAAAPDVVVLRKRTFGRWRLDVSLVQC